jgi:phage shock protein A
MSMQSHQGYDPDSPAMASPRSIDFHNPGTAGHVAGEIQQNYEELLRHRAEVEARYAEETAQFNAVVSDLSQRIAMCEAAIHSYEQTNTPQQAKTTTTGQAPVGRLG